ncbi:hypothetical protein NXS19_000688 [Fusarium pseudograminearum]|nr:hypothetical protein NXS19_000688 [Fusarium pseudograminearum]
MEATARQRTVSYSVVVFSREKVSAAGQIWTPQYMPSSVRGLTIIQWGIFASTALSEVNVSLLRERRTGLIISFHFCRNASAISLYAIESTAEIDSGTCSPLRPPLRYVATLELHSA